MIKRLFFILISFFLLLASCATNKKEAGKEITTNVPTDSIAGVYIPKDMNDCFEQLDILFPDSIKNEIRQMNEDDFVANSHFGIGMWIRNNWGLWKGSRLATYLVSKKDMRHPDDMSGAILEGYYHHLRNEKPDQDLN